ncbi:lipase family protein [Nocardia sp. NPDC051750]|uniref:lipase family protein n=1 Tax=Nocardia sp. NPDC051750 TaxID=3364325 RepID=UPI0037AA9E00
MRTITFGARARSRITWALVTAALLLGGGTAAIPAAAQPEWPSPSEDPFYTYDRPLTATAPGTVLRFRPAPFAFAKLSTPITSTQVLYRTTTQQDAPTAAVTTVLRPLVPGPTRLLSYHAAYDALGSRCNPSYTLTGHADNAGAVIEQAVIAGYLAAGYTVVVPDYEGPDLEWTIGRQSGYAALDGIRAAEQILGLPASTPVAMSGYSGGAVPTEWAAELAPHYAPELALIGAAAGGLPVHLAHNLPYVSGSADWAGVIPAAVVAFRRAYELDTDAFLSERGARAADDVETLCLGQFAGRYPGLTDAEMVRAPYKSLLDVPAAAAAINDNIMGTAGTPVIPLLLAVGQSDPIGDSVMVTRDIEALAHQYCARGVPVTYARYDHFDHMAAFALFQTQAAQFLAARFHNVLPTTNCASIGPGNSLAPIPVSTG